MYSLHPSVCLPVRLAHHSQLFANEIADSGVLCQLKLLMCSRWVDSMVQSACQYCCYANTGWYFLDFIHQMTPGVIHVIYVDDIPVRYTFLFMCFAFYSQGSASTLWRDSCAAPEEVNKTRYPRESSPLFFCHTGKGRSAGGLNRQRTAFSPSFLCAHLSHLIYSCWNQRCVASRAGLCVAELTEFARSLPNKEQSM